MGNTVAAIVVTFNRKDLLLECLEGVFSQTRPVEAIFVIDNYSTDGTFEKLREAGIIPAAGEDKQCQSIIENSVPSKSIPTQHILIRYIRMSENMGGAGGFYEGVKQAFESGFDWLWLMDDDAEPRADALEKLLDHSGDSELSALASMKLSPEGRMLAIHRGFFCFDNVLKGIVRPIQAKDIGGKKTVEIDHASFVGILVSRRAVYSIGYPMKEFFIHYDDVEYCIRLRTVGKILLIPDSIIIHKELPNNLRRIRKFFGRAYEIVPYDKFWLRYYHMRNLVWLGRKYSTHRFKFLTGIVVHMAGSITAAVLFQDHKFKRAVFLFNRYLDGVRNVFDNKKPIRILYGKNV